MLRINRKSDYAVRVMLALAKEAPDIRLPTKAVQEAMLIPPAFLQRIVAELSKNGLIETFPGPNGGLSLARPAETITLKDILTAIDGPVRISDCLDEPEDCALEVTCPVRSRWARLQAMIVRELERTNLYQLAQEAFHLTEKQSRAQREDIRVVNSSKGHQINILIKEDLKSGHTFEDDHRVGYPD